jgi:hypothetical protein
LRNQDPDNLWEENKDYKRSCHEEYTRKKKQQRSHLTHRKNYQDCRRELTSKTSTEQHRSKKIKLTVSKIGKERTGMIHKNRSAAI